MKYKINPSEEKNILQNILKKEGIYVPYNSMAALMNDTKLSMKVKEGIILDCLGKFISDKIVGDNDVDTYEGLKAVYNKHANQDLFRAIGGISLTSSHIETLFASSDYYKEDILELSLFFDIYKDKASYSKMLESVSLEAISNSLLLMPSLYKFTEDKVQEIIANEVGSTIIFAASPYTKDFLTKENFNQVYKLVSNGYDEDYNEEDFVEDLKDAYYDLFGTDLEVA